jgi:hypothetical protein
MQVHGARPAGTRPPRQTGAHEGAKRHIAIIRAWTALNEVTFKVTWTQPKIKLDMVTGDVRQEGHSKVKGKVTTYA